MDSDKAPPYGDGDALAELNALLRQWDGQPVRSLQEIWERLWEMDRQSVAENPDVIEDDRTPLQFLFWMATEEVTCDMSLNEYDEAERHRQVVSWAGTHLFSGDALEARLAEAMVEWIQAIPG